jgi:SH3-like domain-containing protein
MALAPGEGATSPPRETGIGRLIAGAFGPDKEQWVTLSSAVNVRAEPSSTGETIRVGQKGERLRATARQGNWVQVKDPDTAVVGWVYARFIEDPPPEQ